MQNRSGIVTTTHRRDFLRIGSLMTLGISSQLMSAKPAMSRTVVRNGKAKSCILLWLDGGPSHLETFDPKRDVPEEVRGPFQPIATVVPGIELSELLPLTAGVTDKLAIVRSVSSPLGEHGIANQYMLTGYQPGSPVVHPSFGAVFAQHRRSDAPLPNYIVVPESRPSMGAGFLGSSFGPFSIASDPARPDFQVKDLDYFPGVDGDRLKRRRRFLREIEAMEKSLSAGNVTLDPLFEKAFRLIDTPEAKRAFRLEEESEATRSRYGGRTFGQSCLLARRLIERGVGLVSVLQTGWDTHQNLILSLRDGFSGAKVGVGLVPTFDQAFSALIGDLHERRMLDETLVVAMGEFGRTPKLNTGGGRDHWPRVFSVVFAGGGVRGGQVIGASDRIGESPLERPITPADLANTIYSLLGIDPDSELITPDGRPIRINQGGHFISEMV
ncbi:MAG: DUF1501 domain-containing protein [Planctomycetota bacterium]|nr:DUF1501 domain-containing protein [Planctomycetota bacterium]